jgi:uncharacterized protein (TIGR01244 family)
MKRQLNVIAVLVFTLFTPILSAGEAAMTAIEKIDVPGVVNFTRLDDSQGFAGSRVGFGGATQPGAMARLSSKGYVTIISLRLADEEGMDVGASQKAAEAAGLRYIHLPIDPENPAPGAIDSFLEAAGDKANQPLYIHCNSATRAAALWMIGRVLKDGLAPDTASKEAEAIAAKPEDAIAFATAYLASQKE